MFEALQDYGERPCLVGSEQAVLTYHDVARRADALFDGLTSGLLFIDGFKGVDTIVAYVGAIRAGMAVHILNPDKPEENDRLTRMYRPDYVYKGGTVERLQEPDRKAVASDLSLLLSTSGSTGASKLVKLSRDNIASNTRAICNYLNLSADDRGVAHLSPFYSYGISVLNTHLAVGASLLVTNALFEDPKFWPELREWEVTNFAGVPYHFERMLDGSSRFASWPSLRLATQAGGKLSGRLVREMAEQGDREGFQFFVMYGQTEASPRISYLPPALAREHSDSIGRPVPGGRMWLIDADGAPIGEPGVEGELVYAGPNVMCGYAHNRADLSILEPHGELRTGDIARFDDQGLFTITGRASRFVKPFGLRVSLDDIEGWVDEEGLENAVIGDDEAIVIVVADPKSSAASLDEIVANRCGIPASTIRVQTVGELPRLANGKKDYATLKAQYAASPTAIPKPTGFWSGFTAEFWSLLSGASSRPESALAAYRAVLGSRVKSDRCSFQSAGGDSLNMVQLQLALEEYGVDLPEDWPERPIREVEQLAEAHSV